MGDPAIQPLGRAGNLTLMRWPSANWRRPVFFLGGGREGVGDYRGGMGGIR